MAAGSAVNRALGGQANQREASVCIILFPLVARQQAVSEAPGTILCQEILQNIVPPADVLSNFVPFPTHRPLTGLLSIGAALSFLVILSLFHLPPLEDLPWKQAILNTATLAPAG